MFTVRYGKNSSWFCDNHVSYDNDKCYVCGNPKTVRHLLVRDTEHPGVDRRPLCQQHYEEWRDLLALSELVTERGTS